jgi:hypothetical protein
MLFYAIRSELKLKFRSYHHRIYRLPLFNSIVSQVNRVHLFKLYCSQINFNVSYADYVKYFLLFITYFPTKSVPVVLISTASGLSRPSLFNHADNIRQESELTLCNFLQSSLLRCNISRCTKKNSCFFLDPLTALWVQSSWPACLRTYSIFQYV